MFNQQSRIVNNYIRHLPLISVVIATYNSDRTLEKCLSSLRNQDYSTGSIQLIIADGGSTDNTLKIAKKFNSKIINVPKEKQNAEYNKGYGIYYAKGEFILCIDHDNILPHQKWLKNMLRPLIDDKNIVAVEPLRYHYDPSFSLLDRYFALFGVNDPVPYYLGKADRMDYFHDKYNLLGTTIYNKDYYIVEFDQNRPHRIPTLGANGFLIRKSFFDKIKITPEKYFHIDINVDLIKLGFNKYAFIKDDIIHLTNNKILNFLKRRVQFVNQYDINSIKGRRYSVYYPGDKKDKIKLVLFIFYSITFVKPTIDSIKGWLKIHDIAWFIHPFMCFFMVLIYGYTSIKKLLTNH